MQSTLEKGTIKAASKKRTAWIVPALGIVLLISILFASAFGAVSVPITDIIKMAAHKFGLFNIPVTWRAADETIIFQLRFPRVVGAALVGAGLSSAGVIFQGLLRNPLADPYIIGTSAGAAFGATIAMMLPVSFALLGFGLVSLFAFAGGLTTVLIVYNLARSNGRAPVINMLLAGFIVSALLTAAMTFFISLSERFGLNLHAVYAFITGSVSVTSWEQVGVVGVTVASGTAITFLFARHLNAFSLGEEGAAYVGVSVERDKVFLLAAGSLLTAAAVALSGLVGFVGLIVPHAVRLALGPDHRRLAPASALIGAILLVVCDVLARSILAPVEIPVGVITAIIGAPFFIYLLKKTGKKYTF